MKAVAGKAGATEINDDRVGAPCAACLFADQPTSLQLVLGHRMMLCLDARACRRRVEKSA